MIRGCALRDELHDFLRGVGHGVARDELEAHQQQFQVISTRLFAGRTIIHILADNKPSGFDDVEAGLEDVYFTTLADLRRAA